jgi:hypothetical protein
VNSGASCDRWAQESLFFLAQIVAMGFGAVAAGLHRTPSACAILAVVKKEPQAAIVGAFTDTRRIGTNQDIRNGP